MEEFTLLIDGRDVDTGIYDYFPYIDISITDFEGTQKVIGELKKGNIPANTEQYIYAKYCVNKDDTNFKAMDAARRACREFRKFPLSVRKKILFDIHESLLDNKEHFLKLLMIEGHPRILGEWEFEGMRIGSSPETINYYCKLIQKEIGKYNDEILYSVRRPDGVICINPPRSAAASNSFNAILVFLVGNSLIVKPPLKTPISSLFIWKNIVHKVLKKYNAPDGLLNIVIGNSKKLMDEWLESDSVNDIIFFGDSKKGISEGVQIYQANKKPILELSGNDLQIVWEDANLKKSVESLIDGFLGSSQVCMMPKIALIHDAIFDDFERAFVEKVKSLKIGLPSNKKTILSPVLKMKEFFMFLDDAISKGASLSYGGKRINHFGEIDDKGRYIQPTVIKIDDAKKSKEMLCVKDEIFFPLIPLIRFKGNNETIFADMVETASIHNYGLRISVFISSEKFCRKFIKELDNCGILRINLKHVGFSYYISTHGGTKRSGGPFGEMNYFWQKTSHLQGVCRNINRIRTNEE